MVAYGLEDAFAEQPEIGIVRKHRTNSGLIRYDQRRDSDWAQVAREIIAAEKPKYIVMMVGNNDRQPIREKKPPLWPGRRTKDAAQPALGRRGRCPRRRRRRPTRRSSRRSIRGRGIPPT